MKKSNNHFIWVVVPAFNEEETLGEVIDALCEQKLTVVIVDDGSSDHTYEVAKSKPAHVLKHILNLGQGAALETGIKYSLQQGAEFVCTFDADGQHGVNDILSMHQAMQEQDTDVVIGSRFLGQAVNIPTSRVWLLKAGILFHRIVYGMKLTDIHNGLRLMRRSAAKKIEISSPGMAHASEILASIKKHKLNFIEVPVTIHYTEYSLKKGQSTLSFINILKDLFVGGLYK